MEQIWVFLMSLELKFLSAVMLSAQPWQHDKDLIML